MNLLLYLNFGSGWVFMGVQKLVCVNVDKVVTDGKRAPTVAKPGQQKKVIVKPKPEEVIAISPDSEKKVVEKQEKKVTMLSYVIGVGVAFAFIYFFKVILDDLFLIVGCEFAGAVAAYGVDFATQHNLKQMTLYKNALDELKAKDAALKMRDNHYV